MMFREFLKRYYARNKERDRMHNVNTIIDAVNEEEKRMLQAQTDKINEKFDAEWARFEDRAREIKQRLRDRANNDNGTH